MGPRYLNGSSPRPLPSSRGVAGRLKTVQGWTGTPDLYTFTQLLVLSRLSSWTGSRVRRLPTPDVGRYHGRTQPKKKKNLLSRQYDVSIVPVRRVFLTRPSSSVPLGHTTSRRHPMTRGLISETPLGSGLPEGRGHSSGTRYTSDPLGPGLRDSLYQTFDEWLQTTYERPGPHQDYPNSHSSGPRKPHPVVNTKPFK